MIVLEMPYIMNVVLYIDNDLIPKIPFINKKCKDACDAMKINPWKKWNGTYNEIKLIFKVFCNIQTLRIDLETLKKSEQTMSLEKVEYIEIVKETQIPKNISNISDALKMKYQTIYNDKDINENSRKVILKKFNLDTLKNIDHYKNIRCMILHRKELLNNEEIIKLNEVSRNIKVSIIVSLKTFQQFEKIRYTLSNNITICFIQFGMIYIVPSITNTDFCISPLKNIENSINFNNYFLPFKIYVEHSLINFIDLTPFYYVEDIIITPKSKLNKNSLKLPYSTKRITVQYNPKIFDNTIGKTEIVNWNELYNLTEINDHHQLYIPYPQIKKKQYVSNIQLSTTKEKWYAFFNIFQLLYLLISTLYHITNICYSYFDYSYIQQASFYHLFGYIFVNFIVFIGKQLVNRNLSTFEYLFHFSMTWYIYSLNYYQSKYLLHFLTLLTFPSSIIHLTSVYSFLHLSFYDINTFLTTHLRGYWFNVLVERKLTIFILVVMIITSVVSTYLLNFGIFIGLIISWFCLHGIPCYITLISLLFYFFKLDLNWV